MAQDRIPYTYLIGWPKLNMWYYGVRYAKGCNPNELWVSYFTSSKHTKSFAIINGKPDVIQVRKTFSTINKARNYEHKVLRRMQVASSSNFLNKTDNKSISLESALIGSKSLKPYKEGDIRRDISSKRMKDNPMVYENLKKMNSLESREKAIKTKLQKNILGLYEGSKKSRISNWKYNYQSKKDKGYIQPNTFTSEHGKKMADKNNSNSICPVCGKQGQYRAMKRWHFENCKFQQSNVA